MARGRALLLLSLLLIPTLAAASAAPRAEGPDASGAYTLVFEVERANAGRVVLALAVAREDADGSVTARRELGGRDFAAGTSVLELPFLPAEGAGLYTVGLLVDEARVGEVRFAVDDAGGARTVGFDIPDEPTYLNLTSEDVNAAGKLKSPGEVLITRARIADANGLSDVEGVRWRVERAGALVYDGALAWPQNGTSADVEVRFDRAPIAAGEHTLRLVAHRGSAELASAARTFVIREVAPTLVAGALPNVTPDVNLTLDAFLVLADRNGEISGVMEPRVYRASTRVEGAGFSAILGTPLREADAEGTARFTYPLTLRVPERATPGAHRVSLYHDGALVGSVPFEVRAVPTLASVNATSQGNALRLDARGAGDGIVLATLAGSGNARVTAGFVNGSATLSLPAPQAGASYTWTLELRAREDGPTLAARHGSWSAPADGAALRVSPLFVRSRLPASWSVESERDLADANATWSFTRWDGAPEPRLVGELRDGRARVSSPPDLAAGRYTARLRLEWPDATASEATWGFDAGPWVELALGEPVVVGREARLSVRNAGGVTIERLVVESDPAASLVLRVGNASHAPTPVGSRSQFQGAPLAPGEEAQLVVRLPDGALRSGRHEVSVRVLAKVALG